MCMLEVGGGSASIRVQEECSARVGLCVLLNIHDAVKGYRLTQVEILYGYCKHIHRTVARPLTHTHTHTRSGKAADTHACTQRSRSQC